jgi:hypothetical protein
MKNEQIVNAGSEQPSTGCLSLQIEELESIIAPGNTWSV